MKFYVFRYGSSEALGRTEVAKELLDGLIQFFWIVGQILSNLLILVEPNDGLTDKGGCGSGAPGK